MNISFDIDAEAAWIAKDPNIIHNAFMLSAGEYGPRVGLPRILKMLDKYDIKSTFFVPGWVIDHHFEEVKTVHEAGHEIGHHGYLHEYQDHNTTIEEQRDILEKGISSIKKLTGSAPLGHRHPGDCFTPNTIRLLNEYGFVYDSTLMTDEIPFFLKQDGKETNLVEIPDSWILDDWPFVGYGGIWSSGKVMAAPSQVLEIWKGEFDGLYEEGRMFELALHPQLMGRPHRMKMLEEMIQYIKGHSDVWFATCIDIANHWRKEYGKQ